MQPFIVHTGRFVTIDRADINTDAIIPARFLRKIERVGFGADLFVDLRVKDGQPDPDFPLNRPESQGATILVARQNFGCGSSREHAVWAIAQAGFRALVAPMVGTTPGFADIFRTNCYKNGLVPVEVSEPFANKLFEAGTGDITIDLEAKTITAHLRDVEISESIAIPEGARQMLLRGLDEIDLSLQYDDAIAAYEAKHADVAPASGGT